jgi:hypothetical protein
MGSLIADFEELISRIDAGREFSHASFEPIFYLVFHPRQILDVKRSLPAWNSKLSQLGWDVTTFSVADNVADIIINAPLRKLWIAGDKRTPLDWAKTNGSLANALTAQNELEARLEAKLAGLEGKKSALLLVADLEALHPYLRIGAIEARLQGKFQVPTVFLYPGTRTGSTRLKFLGFYPEDGNYRSVHVGG